MDRTSRTLELSQALLQQKTVLNAVGWAERFSVDVRTIQRDLAYLRSHQGLPIVFDPKAKGYRLEGPKAWQMLETKPTKSERLIDIIHSTPLLTLKVRQHALPGVCTAVSYLWRVVPPKFYCIVKSKASVRNQESQAFTCHSFDEMAADHRIASGPFYNGKELLVAVDIDSHSHGGPFLLTRAARDPGDHWDPRGNLRG